MYAPHEHGQHLCHRVLSVACPGFLTVADIKGPPRRIGATRGLEAARGEAGGSIRSSGRGDTIGNRTRTSGEGCTRSDHSTANSNPGSGDTTPHVRYFT
jgi:hypothetical protein